MAKVRRIKKGEPGYGRKKFVATGTHEGRPQEAQGLPRPPRLRQAGPPEQGAVLEL
jgi:hypothetical protein